MQQHRVELTTYEDIHSPADQFRSDTDAFERMREIAEAAAERVERATERAVEQISEAVAKLEHAQMALPGVPAPIKRTRLKRKLTGDVRDAIHGAFETIADTPDMEPTVVNVSRLLSVSTTSLRRRMDQAELVRDQDYAGALHELFADWLHRGVALAAVFAGLGVMLDVLLDGRLDGAIRICQLFAHEVSRRT